MELNVTGLSVARGGIPVLEGLDFILRAGEALILRGPNGVGKTTVVRTIAGLQPPLAGHVGLEREAMAYAGHADGIKSTLTVRENLTFWADIFGTSGVAKALEAFDLVALADRMAGALSAGQKRRLGLARMVVTGRPVWVLDEPTVSLDASAVGLFAQAVRNHLAGGVMAWRATHIDLVLSEARVLDVSPYRAKAPAHDDFDGSFL